MGGVESIYSGAEVCVGVAEYCNGARKAGKSALNVVVSNGVDVVTA